MLKAGRVADAWPSETAMTMLPAVPTLAAVGVPDRRPVAGSKVAQAGLLEMPKVSACPSGSEATG